MSWNNREILSPTTAIEHVSADPQLRHKFTSRDHEKKNKTSLPVNISLTLSLWEQFQKASAQNSEAIRFVCLVCGVHRLTSPASGKREGTLFKCLVVLALEH